MRRFLALLPLILISPPPIKASWWDFSSDCEKKEYSTKVLTEKSKPGVLMINTDKATGSGFVVKHFKNKTLILTNSHVIEGAKKITVQWTDGNQDNAKVVLDAGGETNLTDLALLEIDGKEGAVLKLKKRQAIVGRDVIAIGSPRGLGFTLTKGVISSLRDNGKIVQTDTAINPGSSGGPLINGSGCVVGVNTFKSVQEGDEGLNFAISSTIAQRFVDKYSAPNKKDKRSDEDFTNDDISLDKEEMDKSSRVKIGVGWIQNSENYPEITFVLKGSNAEKAGLKVNDVILSIDSQTTKSINIAELEELTKGKDNSKSVLRVKRDEKILKIILKRNNNSNIKLNPDDYEDKGEAYAYKGYMMLISEKTNLGIENLEKALEFDLRDERKFITLINLAIAKNKLQDFKEALEYANKGLKLNPKDNQKSWVYETIGFSKLQLKDFKGALNDYDTALKFNNLEERKPYIYGNRGMAKANLKKFDEALKDFDKAFEFDLNSQQKEWLLAQLGFLKGQKGDFQGAISNLSEAIEINNDKSQMANLFSARCWNNLNLKIYQSAIDDCNEAIKLNPKDFNAYHNRGAAFSGIFLHREACFDYKKSHALGNQAMGDWLNSRKGRWCRDMY